MVAQGLEGDRYSQGRGFWKSVDACEVTLITQQEIDRACRRASTDMKQHLQEGGHRRNLVVSGVNINQMAGATLKIGDVVLQFVKPRPPCAYIDRVAGDGMCKALGKASGCCIQVVTGGQITVGDEVVLLDSKI